MLRAVRKGGDGDGDQVDRSLVHHKRDVYRRVADRMAQLLPAPPAALRVALMRLCEEDDPRVLSPWGEEPVDETLVDRLREILIAVTVIFEYIEGPYVRIVELAVRDGDKTVVYRNKTYADGLEVPQRVTEARIRAGETETRFTVYPPAPAEV
jgi:ribosomal protein L17